MKVARIAEAVGVLWPVSEAILGWLTRAGRKMATVRDRGSLVAVWITITGSITAAVMLRHIAVAQMSISAPWAMIGLILLAVGLTLRWVAIITLGRLFTPNVAIHQQHTLVRKGVYRHIRHPSYTGLLVAFLGLGFVYGNWLSLAVVVVPITAALLYRVHVEESALLAAFGQQYADYCRSSWCFLPGLY